MDATANDPVTREFLLGRPWTNLTVQLSPELQAQLEAPAVLSLRVERLEPSGRFTQHAWLVKLETGKGPLYVGRLDDWSGAITLTSHSDRLMHLEHGQKVLRGLNRMFARIWADDSEGLLRDGYRVAPYFQARWDAFGERDADRDALDRRLDFPKLE